MARLGDNPVTSPAPAAAHIPCENMDTNEDICVTPAILTLFAQENMDFAGGSVLRGLISGTNADKLTALYTKAELDAIFTQFCQFPFPVFIGSPVDGAIELYRNVLDNDVVFESLWFGLSSGTGILSVTIDGTPITGLDNIAISGSSGAIATALNTLAPGSILGFTFSGMDPAAENLRVTLRGKITLT